MLRKRSRRTLGVVLWVLAGIGAAVAQPADIWRYFSVRHGLAESYVGAVSSGLDGRIWITHGQVPGMTSFDGFTFRQFPSPGVDLRVEEGAGGELWAMSAQPGGGRFELKLLSNGAWKSFPLMDSGIRDPDLLISAIGAQRFLPVARGRAVYVASDGLREFDAVTGVSRTVRIRGCATGTILSLARSAGAGFWIAGERGIGRAATAADGSIGCAAWGGAIPDALRHFSNLFEDGDAIFASARDGDHSRVLTRVTANSVHLLARTKAEQEGICGWSAADGSVWVCRIGRGVERLFRRDPDGKETPAPASKVLSGRITDISVQPGGVGWIASSFGVARVAPPVWRPFGPSEVANDSITSIAESSRKELFFLGAHTLWILSEGRWLRRALPVPPGSALGSVNRMAILAGDKVAIPMRPSVGHARLVVYDRERDRFEIPRIPGFENCTFVAARSRIRAWAACQDEERHVTLFSYDGNRFDRAFEMPPSIREDWPRVVAELSDGSIWVGAFWRDSLFRYADGSIEKVPLPPEASTMGVADIAELPGGRLWIGGRNLVLERSGSTWKVVQAGLETVRSLYLTPEGKVWIAAGSGISECRESGCVLNRQEDGLPEGVAWTVFQDSQNRLLVGTTAGVRLHNRESDHDAPKLDLPGHLNGANFPPGQAVRFVPVAVDRWQFTEADSVLFSHRVDSGAWTPFEASTVVSLERVASGRHILEVRAMDRNFNTSQPLAYPFNVLAPWYRQPAWILLVFCTTGILLFSIHLHLSRHRELRRAVVTTTADLKAEFELHSRSQARFQQILDHAPMLIYVKDLDGRYLISNLRHAEVLGKPRADILDHTDEDLFGPERNAPFGVVDADVASGRKISQTEVNDPAAGRTYYSIQFPLRDPAGIPNAVCGILSDVTDMKKFQQRVQASERLETVGLLAGGVAHDFNNLLTVINGYSDLALKRLPAENPARGALKQIRSAGEHAAGLTAQLLAFGRKQMIQPVVLNPADLMADVRGILRPLIPEDIDWMTRVAPDAGYVRVDPTQFQQILINLALNARDTMPHGGTLRIDLDNACLDETDAVQDPDMRPGEYLRITVADDGAGMAPDVQAHVFEPFYTTKEFGKGTGLGLATVYGMVKQSGGCIRLRSEVGKGTTFSVYLPRTGSAVIAAEASPRENGGSGSETLLLVEDQPEVRQLTASVLRDYGYKVYTAGSGAEALAMWRELGGSIQFLITDVVMPGMRGPELARELRNRKPDLKVLFVSGYSEKQIDSDGIPAADFRFLQKPFTPDRLAGTVRELLGRV